MAKENNINLIEIKWGKPIELDLTLEKGRFPHLKNEADWEKIPEGHGVYFFARRYRGKTGDQYTVRYVGQSKTVRKRIDEHLNNLKLMMQLKDLTRKGGKVLFVGELLPKKYRQQKGKTAAIKVVEKALIDKLIENGVGDYLFNEQLTKPIEVQSIQFSGRTIAQDIFGTGKIEVS